MSSHQQLCGQAARGRRTPTRCSNAGYDAKTRTRDRGRRVLHWLVGLLAGVSLALVDPGARAVTFGGARTGRDAREEAIRAIPFDQLSPEAQSRISAVVDKPSIYRRMPVQVVDCDPSLYVFLVRNPEVVVNIWELMGITRVDLRRTGPFTFRATDGMGTKSLVELVYGTKDVHLVYSEGTYDGPLLRKPVRGRCVLLLRSGYVSTAEGRVHVTNQLDVFLQLDHVALDVLAKTIHPLLGRTADLNFIQTVAFLGRISRNAERNSAGMRRLAGRLERVEPSVRQRFADLTTVVATKSQQRFEARQRIRQVSNNQDATTIR